MAMQDGIDGGSAERARGRAERERARIERKGSDPTPSDKVSPSIPTTTTVAGNSTCGRGLRQCAILPTCVGTRISP